MGDKALFPHPQHRCRIPGPSQTVVHAPDYCATQPRRSTNMLCSRRNQQSADTKPSPRRT
eukprot:8212855-Prorocentrum_lima.AAC.1